MVLHLLPDPFRHRQHRRPATRVHDRYARGEYGFFAPRTVELMPSGPGMLLLEVPTGELEDALRKLYADRAEEVKSLHKAITTESFPKRPAEAPANG